MSHDGTCFDINYINGLRGRIQEILTISQAARPTA